MNTGCSKAGRKSFFFHYSILSMGVRLHGLFFFFHFVILDPVFVRGSFLNFVCSGLWTPNMYL